MHVILLIILLSVQCSLQKWVSQKLDHFNETDTRTWKQRYFQKLKWYKPGGPIFLKIHGEWASTPCNESTHEYAKEFKAALFTLEHRYYGESRPTNNLSTSNLAYLSKEQALADAANFITKVNKRFWKLYQRKPKWIAFGSSYGGSLASWIRLKYPHLVHGAVASSAPLYFKVNFKEFLGSYFSLLKRKYPDCFEAIRQSIAYIAKSMESFVRRKRLEIMFELCEPINPNNKMDLSVFYSRFAYDFIDSVNTTCGFMLDTEEGIPIRRLMALRMYKEIPSRDCTFKEKEEEEEEEKRECWNATRAENVRLYKLEEYNEERPWFYQTCTEFGHFQPSGAKSTRTIFSNTFPIETMIPYCEDVFGPTFNISRLEEGIRHTNTYYEGLGISIDRLITVHGSEDPWRMAGLLKPNNPESPVIMIEGGYHCDDDAATSDDDSIELIKARNEIKRIISSWLQ